MGAQEEREAVLTVVREAQRLADRSGRAVAIIAGHVQEKLWIDYLDALPAGTRVVEIIVPGGDS